MSRFGVFIGCLLGNTDKSELMDLLKSFAKVTSIKLARGRNQSTKEHCVGYGFALCPTTADVDAILRVQTALYRGCRILFRAYRTDSVLEYETYMQSRRRLIVADIPLFVSEEILRLEFEKFGSLEAFYFVEQSKSMKFKYGYAVYRETEDAVRAAQNASKIAISGHFLKIGFYCNNQSEDASRMSCKIPRTYGDRSSDLESSVGFCEMEKNSALTSPCQLTIIGHKKEREGQLVIKSKLKSSTSTADTEKLVIIQRKPKVQEIKAPTFRYPNNLFYTSKSSIDQKPRDFLTMSPSGGPSASRWSHDAHQNHSEANIRLNLARTEGYTLVEH